MEVQVHDSVLYPIDGIDHRTALFFPSKKAVIDGEKGAVALSVLEMLLMCMTGADVIKENITDQFPDEDINKVMNRLNSIGVGVHLCVWNKPQRVIREEDHCSVLKVLFDGGLDVNKCPFLLFHVLLRIDEVE